MIFIFIFFIRVQGISYTQDCFIYITLTILLYVLFKATLHIIILPLLQFLSFHSRLSPFPFLLVVLALFVSWTVRTHWLPLLDLFFFFRCLLLLLFLQFWISVSWTFFQKVQSVFTTSTTPNIDDCKKNE